MILADSVSHFCPSYIYHGHSILNVISHEGGMDAGDLNEDSWEQMHEAGDAPQDLNAWASNDPQNSNGDWTSDEQWETGAPLQAQMPPQPPQKDGGNTKSQKKQHQYQQQHQHQHHQQHHQHQQHQQSQHNDGWGNGGGTWDDAGGTPAPAKKQTSKGNWSQTTQRAMDEPAWSNWGHEAGWEQDGDTSEFEEEAWPAEDDPWGAPAPATTWPQQQSTHAPQAYAQKQSAHAPQVYAQRQPSQQSSWQTWGEEAQRLPKSQQPYAAANPPPGTGGYFQPQGANKQAPQQQSANTQWSQQQAVMSTAFRQQQEQAYALAQAQSQHKQLQLQQLQQQQQQQQQQHRHVQRQQAEAYALAHAQSQHRHQQQHHHQNQSQHHQNHNQLQHHQSQNQPQHYHDPNQLQHFHDSNQLQHFHDPNQPQHHQDPNQPQHEGKKHKKDKESKQSKKEKKRQQKEQQQQQEQPHDNDVWGLGEGWQDLEDDPDDYEKTHDAWGRRVHFSPPHTAPSVAPSTVVENFTVNAFPPNKLGLSTYSSTPSKTLSYAYHGTAASMENRPAHNDTKDFADFIESKGAAISLVAGAFFGQNSRKAKDRFHWMFPPDKDERVASLLAWIQSVSYGLGSFGLHKFLQTRERGALVVNADYRPSKSPNEPAFDWLTYPELQKTMDRTLQESVAFYDPSALVVVFVFLPSKSGNSLAIWRRKIAVPSSVRLAYQAQITQAIDSLSRDYSVYVDEIPPPKSEPPNPPPKKRKWWKLWLST
jgi:hypothetical protein